MNERASKPALQGRVSHGKPGPEGPAWRTWSTADRAAVAGAFVLALAGAIASYLAAGATLGLFIGGVGFASIVTPPMSLAVSQRIQRFAIVLAVSVAVALVWSAVARDGRAVLVLTCYIAALAGLVHLLTLLRVPGWLVPTLVIILAIAWLSWSVWLAPRLDSERAVAALVVAHPIFALNSIFPQLGLWTQQPLMYQLTPLGQDVPYRLPTSIWPCALVHAFIGLLLLLPKRVAAGGEPSDR